MDTRDAITQMVFYSDPPRCVDIAMVLGCSSVSSMAPAIDLYQKGFAGKVLISGKGPTPRCKPEWQVFSEYALSHGIPSSAIMVEPEARNTRENFVFSEALLSREIGWAAISSMAIVTNPIHARRALMTARRYFPSQVALIVLASSEDESLGAGTWWKTRYGRQMVLDELRKIGEYGIKGHLADF